MNASISEEEDWLEGKHLDEVLEAVGRSSTWATPEDLLVSLISMNSLESTNPGRLPLDLVQDRADIDIGGPEFDFVRTIRVFDIRYADQYESRYDGDCNRNSTVVLGTYGTQGEFSWQTTTIASLPDVHVGLERWGENCPKIYHRSVFVDWRDYVGNYGFAQVDY